MSRGSSQTEYFGWKKRKKALKTQTEMTRQKSVQNLQNNYKSPNNWSPPPRTCSLPHTAGTCNRPSWTTRYGSSTHRRSYKPKKNKRKYSHRRASLFLQKASSRWSRKDGQGNPNLKFLACRSLLSVPPVQLIQWWTVVGAVDVWVWCQSKPCIILSPGGW